MAKPSRTAPGAGLHKLVIGCDDADAARTIAGVLGEIAQPAADAVTLFEDGAGWRVEAYYQLGRPDEGAIGEMLGEALGRPLAIAPAEPVADANWVAMSQAALPPVRAGRFTIHGSHDRGRVPRGPNALEIDAGEAFGTAHHATTLGCLLALVRIGAAGGAHCRYRRVLDLGCGSGVLAIAASRILPLARVVASDIDPVAVEVAAANIRINGAGRRVNAVRADGLASPALRAKRFDLVTANILAGPLIALAREVARAVRPGAIVVLSGLLEPQAACVAAAYRAAGFQLAAHDRLAGWATLTLIRRRSRARGARARRAG